MNHAIPVPPAMACCVLGQIADAHHVISEIMGQTDGIDPKNLPRLGSLLSLLSQLEMGVFATLLQHRDTLNMR